MTPQEITDYKRRWMPGIMVEVHSDLRNEAKDYCKKLEKHRYHIKTDVEPYKDVYCFENDLAVERFLKEFDGKKKLRWVSPVQLPLPLDTWTHQCKMDGGRFSILVGESCNWCGEDEEGRLDVH